MTNNSMVLSAFTKLINDSVQVELDIVHKGEATWIDWVAVADYQKEAEGQITIVDAFGRWVSDLQLGIEDTIKDTVEDEEYDLLSEGVINKLMEQALYRRLINERDAQTEYWLSLENVYSVVTTTRVRAAGKYLS